MNKSNTGHNCLETSEKSIKYLENITKKQKITNLFDSNEIAHLCYQIYSQKLGMYVSLICMGWYISNNNYIIRKIRQTRSKERTYSIGLYC